MADLGRKNKNKIKRFLKILNIRRRNGQIYQEFVDTFNFGYGFYTGRICVLGKKKTEEPTTKAQQKQGEKTEAVKEKAVEKEVKKEIKQEATQEEQKNLRQKKLMGKKKQAKIDRKR